MPNPIRNVDIETKQPTVEKITSTQNVKAKKIAAVALTTIAAGVAIAALIYFAPVIFAGLSATAASIALPASIAAVGLIMLKVQRVALKFISTSAKERAKAEQAATKIQAHFREMSSRKAIKRAADERAKAEQAATKIQAHFRGMSSRKAIKRAAELTD